MQSEGTRECTRNTTNFSFLFLTSRCDGYPCEVTPEVLGLGHFLAPRSLSFRRKPRWSGFPQQFILDRHMKSCFVLLNVLLFSEAANLKLSIPRPLFAQFSHQNRVTAINPPATEAQRTLNCKNDFFLDRRRGRRRSGGGRSDDQQTEPPLQRRLPAQTSACSPRAPPPFALRMPVRLRRRCRHPRRRRGRAIRERRADGRQRSWQRSVRAGAAAEEALSARPSVRV